jgi:hypothetical protein
MSCSKDIYVRSTPSDYVLMSVQTKANSKVNYVFDYLATDPIVYDDSKIGMNSLKFYVKKSYLNQMDQLLQAKYPSIVTNGQDFDIKLTVQHIEVSVEKSYVSGEDFSGGGQRNIKGTASLTVSIEITGKKNIKKIITSNSEQTEQIDSKDAVLDIVTTETNKYTKSITTNSELTIQVDPVDEIIKKALEDCISKSLISSSEFLDESI